MAAAPYDPQKAHDYYERTKQLKGRSTGVAAVVKKTSSTKVVKRSTAPKKKSAAEIKKEKRAAAQAKVVRITKKLATLHKALGEARHALAIQEQKARDAAAKKKKENSDGKSTAAEKEAAKKYRDKHKTELANKAKTAAAKAPETDVNKMSTDQLNTRIAQIEVAITEAKSALKAANNSVKALAHTDFVLEGKFIIHSGQKAVTTDRKENSQNGS